MKQYEIFITPRAWREAKALPGHMRQRIRHDIDSLAHNPHPPHSKALKLLPDTDLDIPEGCKLRRLRIDRWRVVYGVSKTEQIIDVLTIQKRPPYDYGDLSELVEGV
ncbi:type II toxin-antitoxin system RelE family toxin [Candidatus Oscillochloris fontis]|uniref:type II toxin-antitoxin system RelE family toxin n=1 Tax=Candidatus Oscillochloris fontis TaxID=2496868 RepID=UPI00101C470F|nr:type II toxin-antitoxin system RelE/ParE family toxin [Candidatus Oscillochloris fontis]